MVDANEALHGHGGTKQQWAKAIKDHGYAHEVAEVAVWIYLVPIEMRNMEGDHNGTCDQETHKISNHQASQEDQEGGA